MNEPHHQQHELGPEPAAPDLAIGHEVSDVSIGGLVKFLVALVVSLIVVVLAVAWLFDFLADRAADAEPPKSPLANLRDTVPPAPRLQESPAFDLRVMRGQEMAALKQTRWIDQQAKVLQMPVDRAMQLIAERGLPDWPPVEAKPADAKQADAKPAETTQAAGDAKQKQTDDAPGTGKNADAKSREPLEEKQPSDVTPRGRNTAKSADEEQP
jgi:hypothetical protein